MIVLEPIFHILWRVYLFEAHVDGSLSIPSLHCV